MEIRQLGEDDIKRGMYMSAQAFRHGKRIEVTPEQWLADPKRPPSTSYGVWDEGGMQAKVTIDHFKQQFGPESVINMGGLAGVACLPASRGRGYAGDCIRYSLERMRDNDEPVSTLFPFSYRFYQGLGWGWVGVNRRYTVQTRDLRVGRDSGTENVFCVEERGRGDVYEVYSRFSKRYRGMIVRPANHWAAILDDTEKEHTFTYLYLEPSTRVPEGYLTFRGSTKVNTNLREFVSLTPRAHRALLGLLHRHEMQIDSFSWDAPDDDLLWEMGFDHHVKTELSPVTMGRIVDLPAAMAALRPAIKVKGRAVIELKDENAPWNTGTWSIEAEGGSIVTNRTQLNAGVEIDIESLSQAFYGSPSLASIRLAERVKVNDESHYNVLLSLLDGPPMHMKDSF